MGGCGGSKDKTKEGENEDAPSKQETEPAAKKTEEAAKTDATKKEDKKDDTKTGADTKRRWKLTTNPMISFPNLSNN